MSYFVRLNDSIADGNFESKSLDRLRMKPEYFCRHEGMMLYSFLSNTPRVPDSSYNIVYIGASGYISCKTSKTFSAPPSFIKKSCTIAIFGFDLFIFFRDGIKEFNKLFRTFLPGKFINLCFALFYQISAQGAMGKKFVYCFGNILWFPGIKI